MVLTTDAEQARAVGRKALEIYLNLTNYLNSWKRLGFTDDDVAKPGSDRLVDAVVAYGTVDAIAARLQRAPRRRRRPRAGAGHSPEQPGAALTELAGPLGLPGNEGTMTEAVASSPLGRFGVWTFGSSLAPEQAAEIERSDTARSGSAVPPAADLAFVEPILAADRHAAAGHRHRQRVDRTRRRASPSPITASKAPTRAGSCWASASAIPSTPRNIASPTTCWSSTSTNSMPRGARQPPRASRAGTQGAAAGGRTQRGRPPVPDDARAHRPRRASWWARRCFWRRNTRWC